MKRSTQERVTRYGRFLAGVHLSVLLAAVPVALSAQTSPAGHDDHWIEQFYPPGLDGRVRVTTIYQGDLIVGGDFAAAGNTPMNHIGRWDGQKWHSLGNGFDYSVEALLVHDGKLFAGGNFTLAGGDTVNHVAYWDGAKWNPMGNGFLAPVTDLTVYNGQIIAVGQFRNSWEDYPPPENPDIRLAALWNGQSWEAMGTYEDETALNGAAKDLIVYKNDLIAAGSFWSVDPVTWEKRRFGAATWDGTRWNVFGPELSGGGPGVSFESLISYGGSLVAGGVFRYADGVEANRILAWDGLNWFPIGEGFDGSVRDLVEHNGKLLATGYFTASGGTPVNSIASWDGASWTSFGEELDRVPAVLASFNGALFAGGLFERAGGASFETFCRMGGIVLETSWRSEWTGACDSKFRQDNHDL